MPRGPKGEKRPVDVIGNAVHVMRIAPALAADVVDRLWSMGDLVALIDEWDDAQPRQKPGRKPKMPAA